MKEKPLNYFGFGFDEDTPDNIKTKLAEQREKNGFDGSECVNLDHTIVAFTLSRLKYFREHHTATPACFKSKEQFDKILDRMITGFQYKFDGTIFNVSVKESKVIQHKINDAYKLFGKYGDCLWD